MKDILRKLGLNSDNSIIIGSGILQALGIRKSRDIDVVATQKTYDRLKKTERFEVSENHGHEILKYDTFEVGTNWYVLGRPYEFEDFADDSIILDGVRYITLEFLYRAKKSWIKEKTIRPKDMRDLKLIEEYRRKFPT